MNNIVLIGFMGSGKTTFGRWVSRRHNRKFYDTDEYIEKKQNTTISEIFATKGEEAFRDMETEAVKSYQILLITASYLLVADLC